MRSTKGLTLIEVLIAIVIVSLVAGITASFFISSMRNNADNRIREQALVATQSWLDRFRAKSLNFGYFQDAKTYDYGYNYASDSNLVDPSDPNKAQLNTQWQPFKFTVETTPIYTDPLIWRVDVKTYYHSQNGREASLEFDTLVSQ